MAKAYNTGRRGENLVQRAYRAAGARVWQSPGSRGSADLIAELPDGRIEYVQVKTSAVGKAAWPSRRSNGALKSRATRTRGGRATPVVAQVDLRTNTIERRSARTRRQLRPLRGSGRSRG